MLIPNKIDMRNIDVMISLLEALFCFLHTIDAVGCFQFTYVIWFVSYIYPILYPVKSEISTASHFWQYNSFEMNSAIYFPSFLDVQLLDVKAL